MTEKDQIKKKSVQLKTAERNWQTLTCQLNACSNANGTRISHQIKELYIDHSKATVRLISPHRIH